MDRIRGFDEGLNNLFKEFDEIAASIPFNLIGNLLDGSLVDDQKYPGIYLIEVCTSGESTETIENWLTKFCEEWLDEKYTRQFVANPKKKRLKIHLDKGELDEWMPLYIGKSKNINRRLWEHVNLPLNKSTFALKLKERPTMITRSWRFSTINLQNIRNYDILAPKIEQIMRKKFHPIVGKQ